MNNTLLIRDAREDERDAIENLTLEAYAEYALVMAPGAWAALRQAVLTSITDESPAERIVAEQSGRLIGSVLLFPPVEGAYSGAVERLPWPELRALAVAPAGRGKGVAKALIDECVWRARRAGAIELGLHTSDSMRVAMRMYERMGFVRAPEYDFQPEGGELVKAYRRSLAADA